MAEAHLYLLCADLLLRKERRVGMAERVKAQICGEIQPPLEIGEEVRHSGQCDRLRLVAQGAENIAVLCERNSLPQEDRREPLPPYEEVLHCCLGECDRAGTVRRLGRSLVLLCGAFPSL